MVGEAEDQSGLQPDYAAILAGLDDTIDTEGDDRTTQGVARLTGQASGSFREFAKGNVGNWHA